MTQVMAIVGMGAGNGMAIARRFAKEGFEIAMMARSETKLKNYQAILQDEGFAAHYFVADAGEQSSVHSAFKTLQQQLGIPKVLLYNAAVPRMESVLTTTVDALISDFKVNVAGAVAAVQAVLPGMQSAHTEGAILLTGGGFALYPQPDFASLSIGKAGLRSLASILSVVLQPAGIKIGTITICGTVDEADPKYNSTAIAEEYWKFYATPQANFEVIY